MAGQPAASGNLVETGGVFCSADGGNSWAKVNDLCPRPFYYGQIRVDPTNEQRVYVLGLALHVSTDGGKTFTNNGARGVHADHHALWIDPRDPQHLVLGGDGGLSFSYDRGATWEHLPNLPIGQFYAAALDSRRPYRIYGGLQDNGTWGGPSATHRREGITAADWFRVLGGDGFRCQVDPDDAEIVYAEGQYGTLQRVNVRTGRTDGIQPQAATGAPAYRFNWNAPLLVSPQNRHALYYGGNHVFRSVDRGSTWQVISPDLTRGSPGPNADRGHTLTALAVSPLAPALMYAGSDDGRLQVRKDRRGNWIECNNRLSVTADGCITSIECSHFAEGTAYVAVDRHRHDDPKPYLFRTTDYGRSWQALTDGLPADGFLHVVREDPRNPELLYVGTELGLFISSNGGGSWTPLEDGFPTVAVRDLVVHSRDRDLVIATHGRGLFVLDSAPLQELTPSIAEDDAHLFEIKPALRFYYHGAHGNEGVRAYAAANPPYGALIYYYLLSNARAPVELTVSDALGRKIADLKGERKPGLHSTVWDLRSSPQQDTTADPAVPAGDYNVSLKIGERVWKKPLRVDVEE
jgi:hypothetical protein